jgi:hypothetical protein
VLNGYTVTSLEAVQSDPAVLYACVVHGPLTSGSAVQYTILRSSDFGSHWQDVGSKAGLVGGCQLAVNSTDSNELYVVSGPVGGSGSGSVSYALKHSTDGGQTWTAITPALHGPDVGSAFSWNVQQISLEGNTLFGIQWIFPGVPFPHPQVMPGNPFPLGRLVESGDGGHTWTVIDSHFDVIGQGVSSYAVNPSDPRTIYEIVGGLWLPGRPQEGSVPTIYGINQTLYKTTDGGATWTPVLNDVRLGSRVQLVSASPNVVYVGGQQGLLPMEGKQGRSPAQPQQASSSSFMYGGFLLRVSNDGGIHWSAAAKGTQLLSVLNWFVSSDGQVYILESSTKVVRYNLATDTWSTLTLAPTNGALQAVTSTDAPHGAALWLMSTSNGTPMLYRYVA